MKKNNKKLKLILGAICIASTALSIWYSITFNDSRLAAPMNASEYSFRVQDLPMILSISLLGLYLAVLLVSSILAANRTNAAAQTARTVNPRLGLLGFAGFLGFLGFWTYHMDKTVFPFAFFLFFGFFGFFYEGKMAGTLMDERYKENELKAQLAADKTAVSIIFLSIVILGQGAFMGNLEYTLIALIIIISLSLALEIFLGKYLLYRYDHSENALEGEEE